MRILRASVDYRFVHRTNKSSIPSVIFECHLYDEDEVWRSIFLKTGASKLYFFNKLPKKKGGRTVGAKGTWRSSWDKSVTNSDSVQIGSKRSFSYREKSTSSVGLGFVMDKYSLDAVFCDVHPEVAEYVVCCVRKKQHKSSGDAGFPTRN